MLVYLVKDSCVSSSCEFFEVFSLNNYREFWVKCGDLYEALRLLEKFSSCGSVFALGNLAGLVRRFLPATQEEFLRFALSELTLREESEIVAEILGSRVVATDFLVSVSSRLWIDVKNMVVRAVLAKPTSTSVFFDNKLRLVRPSEAPPKLVKRLGLVNKFSKS